MDGCELPLIAPTYRSGSELSRWNGELPNIICEGAIKEQVLYSLFFTAVTHDTYGMFKCRRRSIDLVFSRSTSTNHAKILILGVHLS